MKRASVPQNVAEFKRKLIRIPNTVSEACTMAAQFGQTAEGDDNTKTIKYYYHLGLTAARGRGNNKLGNTHDNTKEEKRDRGNITSADVNSNKHTCNHCG